VAIYKFMVILIVLVVSTVLAVKGYIEADAVKGVYSQCSSMTTQTPRHTRAQSVVLEINDGSKTGVDCSAISPVTIRRTGLYFVIAAGQVGASRKDTQGGYLDLWLIRNGKPVANSNTRQYIRTADDTAVLVSQAAMELNAGDTLSLGFRVSDANQGVGLVATPSTPEEPGIPSMIFSVMSL
jgi:hypothetical protein